MINSGVFGGPAWTRWVGACQCAVFLAFVAIVLMPSELPDPFALGLSFSLTALCLMSAALVLLPDLLAGRWPSTAADRVLAVLCVLVTIDSFRGTNPHNTIAADLSLVGNLALFYATVMLARKAPQLMQGTLLLIVGSIALSLLMSLIYHAEVGLHTRPKLYPVPEGWSGYPELSMLAAIQFGVLVAALLTATSIPMFFVTAALIVVNLVQLALLYARAAWPTIGLIVIVGGSLITRRRQVGRVVGMISIVALAGTLLFLAVPTIRYVIVKAVSSGNVPTWAQGGVVADVATPDMRLQIWSRTLRMIADHPIRGVGPGNFQQVFESRYNPDLNDDGRRGVHAHNLWLHQFGELGLAGGTTYVVLWGTMVVLCWRSARANPCFVTLGLLLAIVAALGSNVLTNMFYLTGGASGRLHSLTWILFGLAAGTADVGRHSPLWRRKGLAKVSG